MPEPQLCRDLSGLIDKTRLLEVLMEEGRPLSTRTVDNYRRRPPPGWPQPQYVGRTPLWPEQAIRDYAHMPPGRKPRRRRKDHE